ncbi:MULTISPECIES: hypothetical protein [unclassified Bradyrhizobium]|uniref:hypothetical protein n=1 Tax=unclassified Bradyrhizobium TaxID=2631580 RepID=UPI0020B30286|nr:MULTISPECIES: hypothetical protein [unclassified Bradyrhizobium]MCP3379751.1 hypothetical protein [Bradyrhizobium sp. CCGUVB4N]MCP3440501.1 hypothetical protein [Bradyrhizobium sp. CCGUVB14]
MNWKLTAAALGFGIVILNGFNGAAIAADAVRVRGVIEATDGSKMTVKTREGASTAIALAAAVKVMAVAKASVEDIKPGDFVGIASLPKSKGGDGAVEVLIFPAAMKGTGEGSYPWDLKPQSTMTNATVSNAVKEVDGHEVTVKVNGKDKKISVADGTVVVTLAPATAADLKPGTTVFVPTERGTDGTLTAGFVIVGANGIVPPM